MPEDQQPTGFFNRASVVLFLVFIIPASLTFAGTYYVAQTGRVPGGQDSSCVVDITQVVDLKIDIYAYVAGLVEFEIQTVSIRSNDGEWQELFSDTIPVPQMLTCDNALTRLDENNLLIRNQKSVAWSNDEGLSWQVYSVCDDPQSSGGRCDAEALSISEVDFQSDGSGTLIIIESAVDEFGEPQRDENDNPMVDESWQLTTTDFGQTWSLAQID